MRGATQPNGVGMGDLGARANQGLGGNIGSFEGLEGAQQIGGQNEVASIQQSPMTERFGGTIEAGAVGQEAMGQAGLGGGGGLGESPVSRMTEGTLGGRTGNSMQGLQGIQSMQDIQGVQGMQSMASALTGGQGQGGMLNENGGVNALQGQGMMGTNLQGGIQSILGGGGGGLGGLQTTMGGGNDIGQQQMAFKKVSKLLSSTAILFKPVHLSSVHVGRRYKSNVNANNNVKVKICYLTSGLRFHFDLDFYPIQGRHHNGYTSCSPGVIYHLLDRFYKTYRLGCQ